MIRSLLIAALMTLLPLATQAKTACDGARHSADTDCLTQALQAAEHRRDHAFKRLDAKLAAPRQAALRADEQAWTETRDRVCGQDANAQPAGTLTCRLQ